MIDVIKTIPFNNREWILHNNIPDNFNELPFTEKVKYTRFSYSKIVFNKRSDIDIIIGNKRGDVVRRGRNIFIQHKWEVCTIIHGDKIKTNCGYNTIEKLLNLCGITWCKDLPVYYQKYIIKSSILKDILKGNIYSEETLCKTILRKNYHIKDVPWRVFRDYLHSQNFHVSILDLKCFTKNVSNSLKVIASCDFQKGQLLRDLLQSAVQLDEVVDFTWSNRRLNEEHLRQTRLLLEKEISAKDEKEIYCNRINGEHIKMLNTEKEIFFESKTMHHCIYTCYYNKIRSGQYLAFHMSFPEDCTFGVKFDGLLPELDQIYLKYDVGVKLETRKIAEDFIKSNLVNLYNTFINSHLVECENSPTTAHEMSLEEALANFAESTEIDLPY